MSDKQRDSTAKFLYDLAKGVGLIAVVGGLVSGQTNWKAAILGVVGMVTFFAMAFWLEGPGDAK